MCASHAFIAGRKDERLENRAVLVHLYSGYFHTLTKVAFLKASSQNNFTLLVVEVVLIQVNLSKQLLSVEAIIVHIVQHEAK